MIDDNDQSTARASFLGDAEVSEAAQTLFDEDVEQFGFVMNISRMWAHQPAAHEGLFSILGSMVEAAGLDFRDRGVLVSATASTFGDAYCSLAWGGRLAGESDPETAAAVLRGDDQRLQPREQAMAAWARAVASRPTETTEADVGGMRAAGFTDDQIAAITVFIACRIAFSTVNNALGSRPDAGFRAITPAAVLDAVTYGRPIADS